MRVTKQDIQKALVVKKLQLQKQGESNIKSYEVAFQDVLENLVPDKSWWEITNCNIFGVLFNTRDVDMAIQEILDNINPNMLEESTHNQRYTKYLYEGKTYQYKGYTIDDVNGYWQIYTSRGKQVGGDFETDRDAEEYIDTLENKSVKEGIEDYSIDNLTKSLKDDKKRLRDTKKKASSLKKLANKFKSDKSMSEGKHSFSYAKGKLQEWVDIDGYEHPNIEMGGYTCYSYYSRRGRHNYYGLEDTFETYDYSDAEAWIWDKLQRGNYCTLETPDGYIYFNPDMVKYGEEVYGIEDYLEERVKTRSTKPTRLEAQEVKTYRNKRNPNKYIDVKHSADGHYSQNPYMKWEKEDGTVVKNHLGSRANNGAFRRANKNTRDSWADDYEEIKESRCMTSSYKKLKEGYPDDYVVTDLSIPEVQELIRVFPSSLYYFEKGYVISEYNNSEFNSIRKGLSWYQENTYDALEKAGYVQCETNSSDYTMGVTTNGKWVICPIASSYNTICIYPAKEKHIKYYNGEIDYIDVFNESMCKHNKNIRKRHHK